jgi:hypothetical protein
MLDRFEARLADLFADLLAGTPSLALPQRSLPSAAPANGILPVVRVLTGAPRAEFGDDALRQRRRVGGIGLRVVLALEGMASIDLLPAVAIPRPARLDALDRVLAAFQAEAVRSGAAFDDGTDQGFALRGFRLREMVAAEEGEARLRTVFAYEGDFWPVRPEEDGPAIAEIRSRIATLPVTVPLGLAARAGGPDVTIPIGLDLRSLAAGPVRVVARLAGAAPPGSLVGAAALLPGFIEFPVDADGVARVVFRPAAIVAAPAIAGISVALAGVGRPTVALAEIAVRVLP